MVACVLLLYLFVYLSVIEENASWKNGVIFQRGKMVIGIFLIFQFRTIRFSPFFFFSFLYFYCYCCWWNAYSIWFSSDLMISFRSYTWNKLSPKVLILNNLHKLKSSMREWFDDIVDSSIHSTANVQVTCVKCTSIKWEEICWWIH